MRGVSGISADSRELLNSDQPEARQALDLFCLRIAGEAARLNWLGIELDEAANASRISSAEARVAAFVIPTEEESVIAEDALTIVQAAD